MRISDPRIIVNPTTFAQELMVKVFIPLEPIVDAGVGAHMTEQELTQLIGEEVMNKIKTRHQ